MTNWPGTDPDETPQEPSPWSAQGARQQGVEPAPSAPQPTPGEYGWSRPSTTPPPAASSSQPQASAPHYQSFPPPQAATAASQRAQRPVRVQEVHRRRPQLAVVTWSIIALCVAVWGAEVMIPGFYEQVDLSAQSGRVQPLRFLTSAFAHAIGITHLAFNMLALWSVGRFLELALGRARYLALYLTCALAGGVTMVLFSSPNLSGYGTFLHPAWDTSVVGASGAVFGLFGALLVLYRRIGASAQSMWLTLALNAVISFTLPGIAWQAHLGGFLAGVVAGGILLGRPGQRPTSGRAWGGMTLLLVAVLAAAVLRYALV